MKEMHKKNIALMLAVVIIVSLALLFIQLRFNIGSFDIGNSTQGQIKEFKNQCDNLYGKGNWTEYGADWIDFDLKSDPPLYFKNTHSFTCFKTGAFP